MITKRGFTRCNVICDQGFFAFEDIGIYLVAKINSLIMPKGELSIEKHIHLLILLTLMNITMIKYVYCIG
jgi:hypothetical protein